MWQNFLKKVAKAGVFFILIIFFGGCKSPNVEITSLENGQNFKAGQEITFQAQAVDFYGTPIENVFWFSRRDGKIGKGVYFVRNDLSAGAHEIIAWVINGGGINFDSVVINILKTTTTTITTTTIPIITTIPTTVPTTITTTTTIAAEKKILIDGVSPYGESFNEVWGHVEGIAPGNFKNFGVSCIIEVEDVWWSKPFSTNLISPIASDGTFRININTGGSDRCAKKVRVCLVPINSQNVPNCVPCFEPTDSPDAISCVSIDRAPAMRNLSFSGYEFDVKYGDCPIGPGPNYFSDDIRDVFVDEAGLHLTIKKRDGRWLSTEVIGQDSFGYGTYTFVINSRIDILDPNVVLGIFTWDETAYTKSYREVDIEFAKWGLASNPTNSQFVLQPCSACPGCGGNCSRYSIDLNNDDKYLTCYLVWQEGEARLRTYYGNYQGISPPANALVSEYVFSGEGVPEPGEAKVRFNLWLFHGNFPTNGLPEEVIIESFSWQEGNMGW